MAAVDEYAIPLVLVRSTGGDEWVHVRQINEAHELYPDRWDLIYEDRRSAPKILLFRIRGNAERNADTAKLTSLSEPRALSP